MEDKMVKNISLGGARRTERCLHWVLESAGIKRALKKLKNSKLSFADLRKAISNSNILLKPGLFYYWRGKVSKKSVGIPILINKNSLYRKNDVVPQKSLSIVRGGWSGKSIFIYEDYVVSYYDQRGSNWLTNIYRLQHCFRYPYSTYLELNNDLQYSIAEKVPGKVCVDFEHIVMLGNSMINSLIGSNFSKKSSYQRYEKELQQKIRGTILYCVQHGDASLSNVLWTSDSEYKFIDLDTIGMYPLCYDLFRMILTDGGREGLNAFVDGDFDENLEKLFFSVGEKEIEKAKDKYLAVFYVMSAGRWSTDWAELSQIPNTYTQTRNVITASQS